MRKDLNKQLCERERVGSSRKYAAVRNKRKFSVANIDEDTDLPANESMLYRHRYGWNTKSLNENLNPLWGILRKAVGRKWDDFYSELSVVFDKRSVINNHILEHLYDKIIIDVKVGLDGRHYVREKYGTSDVAVDDLKYTFTEYYVNPTNGIICRLPNIRTYGQREKETRTKKRLAFLDTHICDDVSRTVYHKIDDTWFAFELIKAPFGTYEIVSPSKNPEEQFECYGKMLEWDRLPEYKKKVLGRVVFTGQTVRDEYFNKTVFLNSKTKRLESLSSTKKHIDYDFRQFIPLLNKGYYHANKRTVNKKDIKKLNEIMMRNKDQLLQA